MAGVETQLHQIADRPRRVAERREQLEWWVARLEHYRRDAITLAHVRGALAELRCTHAASTCNHYRQAFCSLFRGLDGRGVPKPAPQSSQDAQRRPGREPRRHEPLLSPMRYRIDLAQRRPGREPRRHPPAATR